MTATPRPYDNVMTLSVQAHKNTHTRRHTTGNSRGEDVVEGDDVAVVVAAGEEGQMAVGAEHVLLHHVGALVELLSDLRAGRQRR